MASLSLIQTLARYRRMPLLVGVFAGLTFSSARAVVDTDQNGWSDIWEAKYGTGFVANEDADSDDYSNSEEYLAGSDPLDSGSVPPSVTASKPSKTLTRLEWPTVPGKLYQLEVSFDGSAWTPWGAPRVGDGSLMAFEFPKAKSYLTGGIPFSRWLGMSSGSGMNGLKSNVSGHVPPSVSGVLPTLETAPNIADNYGQWIRGWLLPPKSGTYSFWIASDDNSELHLSTNADPANVKRIAHVPGWTTVREWNKYPEQASAPVKLKAGVPYYVEVFHRESGGGDHVSVAWTGPGLAKEGEILSGKYIAALPESVGARIARGDEVHYRVSVTDTDSDADGLAV